MMRIIFFTNKQQLNNFVGSQKMSQFLQSWQWGEFQEKTDRKIIRLGVESETGELLAIAILIKKTLPMGKSYFFCPRGPILNNFQFSIFNFQFNDLKFSTQKSIQRQTLNIIDQKQQEVLNFSFSEIKKIAKSENVIFLRLEPIFNFQLSTFNFQLLKTIDAEPSKTLILDLKKTEEELLKEMHQKTRYNIKLAEKKELELIVGSISDFKDFWQLASQTSERDNFRLHDCEYYRKMIETDGVKLFFVKYKKRFIATGIFSFFADTVVYLHGASANFDRNVMAPFFLHWQCIKLAKSQGFSYYDFNGIDEIKWPGVTRFKKGFGGFELNFPGTFDVVFNKFWYSIYKIIRKIRRIF